MLLGGLGSVFVDVVVEFGVKGGLGSSFMYMLP